MNQPDIWSILYNAVNFTVFYPNNWMKLSVTTISVQFPIEFVFGASLIELALEIVVSSKGKYESETEWLSCLANHHFSLCQRINE